jgi:heterodisulfide reductase subunit A-like polyferredoxin
LGIELGWNKEVKSCSKLSKIIRQHKHSQNANIYFSNIRIFPKVTKNFWAEMKKNFKTFTISLRRLKFQKTARKFKIVFFGGAFLEFFSPKSF